MTIEIKGLYEIDEIEKLVDLFLGAFGDYPKLEYSFPKVETRKAALEASLRFYCAYDMRYGKAYALDQQVNEAILMVESEKMKYSFLKHVLSGSYSKKYRQVMGRMTRAEKKRRSALFAELDRLELGLDLPDPHIYLDFLGVKPELQGQGRGRKLMESVCRYADEREVPLMLFTNTQEDVRFYTSLDFQLIGETKSEKFGFTNWYMAREVKPAL